MRNGYVFNLEVCRLFSNKMGRICRLSWDYWSEGPPLLYDRMNYKTLFSFIIPVYREDVSKGSIKVACHFRPLSEREAL